jgi:MFS family permease
MTLISLAGRGADAPDSPYSWLRLGIALAFGTLGGAGMWSVVVVLPAVQAEFGVLRAEAALPYTLTMVGFAFGGVLMGRLSDRFGILVPALVGAVTLSLGYVLSTYAATLWQFALIYGLLVGIGTSVTFGPLIADVSHFFARRRGIAVAVCASGNYFAGALWPPVVQHFTAAAGWRATHIGIGVFCIVTLIPIALLMRRRPAHGEETPAAAAARLSARDLGLTPNQLQALICLAGVACCVAMSMPQVHIVAYCGDLGYGVARGAEMLSLMLAFGIVSRVASGFVADRLGGVATLLIGSTLQGLALFLYLWFDGLVSLYVISALFGLFQGGIVPSYAIIVREYFPPREAGTRVGLAIMATLFGMAFGGWMSGYIFDLTGSYRAAFLHGIAWNLLNVTIAAWLLMRPKERVVGAA